MTALELFAVTGFRKTGMVRNSRGEALGYTDMRGENECRLYAPTGTTLGIARRSGKEIILTDLGGRTIERFKTT